VRGHIISYRQIYIAIQTVLSFFSVLLFTDIPIAIRICFLTNSKYSHRTEYTYLCICICVHLCAGWGQAVAFLQLLPKNLLVSSKPAIIVQASNVDLFRDCRAEDQ